jgi:hypothetical protein
VSHFVREVVIESLFTGYQWSTLFAPLEPHLDTVTGSFNAPFWTLHVELWGSFLVMALVAMRHVSRKLYCLLLIATPFLFWSHPLMLFVVGHLLAEFALRPRGKSVWRALAAAASLALGIALCCTRDWHVVDSLREWLTPRAVRGDDLFHFQSQLGGSSFIWPFLRRPVFNVGFPCGHSSVWAGFLSASTWCISLCCSPSAARRSLRFCRWATERPSS